MDTSVKACDDFYRFAVGKWRDTHPLPPQYRATAASKSWPTASRRTARILEQMRRCQRQARQRRAKAR